MPHAADATFGFALCLGTVGLADFGGEAVVEGKVQEAGLPDRRPVRLSTHDRCLEIVLENLLADAQDHKGLKVARLEMLFVRAADKVQPLRPGRAEPEDKGPERLPALSSRRPDAAKVAPVHLRLLAWASL